MKQIIAVFSLQLAALATADTSVHIDVDRPIATINKNIYGQFAEHLGRGIYGGLWVGPESDIPNSKGWRNDVVGALQDLSVPVVRWPGGCFADDYHWRDGVGPRDQRPVKVNTLWGGVLEDNAVGTHEYFELIEMLGADAYINGNLGTGSPQEMAEWVEYLTSESQSDLAELRRKNGRDKPYRVQHFGIGNESWGCGGAMSPEYYTNLYKHWSTFLRAPWGVKTNYVASGGHGYGDAIHSGGLTEWTEYLTANIKPDFLVGFDAVSFHYYTHPKGSVFEDKGPATGFEESEWISTLANTLKMDHYIAVNREVMDKNDPEKKIGLYIDEWGTWYNNTTGTNPAFLQQKNSLRDAIVAALNFNIFHKYADRVQMTNIAQMVNVLQAMILTDKDQMVLTPTYHAYKMYVPFQEAVTLAVKLNDVTPYQHNGQSIPTISVSAARAKDGQVYLAVVNTNPNQAETIEVNITGMVVKGVKGKVLTADKMDAHNTFSRPQAIEPKKYHAKANKGLLTLQLPAKSIVVVAVE